MGDEIRSEEDYYKQMQSWAQAKRKKIEELAQRQEEEEKLESTFKPELNHTTQAIMKKYASRVPIYEKTPLPKKTPYDTHCTFKPNLNKTTKK